jgi:tetratricopeptide (TPR) repeat protein
MAIMHARFHTGEKRDYEKAAVWLLRALRYTTLVPNSESRVVNEVFLSNTQALIEMRTGRPREALRLLSAGLERLERDAPASLEAESIILLRNRARVHVALGQTEAALANYTALLAREPSNSEAHLDRGLIYQRLGRLEQALQDYDLAIAWSPPYDEVYFNRAQTLSALGRKDEALSDYRYVLDLQPDHVGALLNRAGLLYERQDYAAAREDVHRALALSPSDARVLCLLGLLQMQEGRLNEAYRSFSTAMAEDRSLASPWINRATLLAANGNPEAALRDLDRALGLDDDVTAFYNRGRILQAQGRWPEASADYSRALDLAPGDARHILAERDLCDRAMRPG